MDTYFQPERELIGNVEATLDLLLPAIQGYKLPEGSVEYLKGLKNNVVEDVKFDRRPEEGKVHPLDLIEVLQDQTKDDMTVTVDVGSHYIWMARYFKSYEHVICFSQMGCNFRGCSSLGHFCSFGSS